MSSRAGGGVPEAPAEGLGFGFGERPGEAQLLKPAHEGVGEADDREPGPVGVDVGEREAVGTGVFETADVVFDVRVGADVGIEVHGVAVVVGVVAPVAELQRREQGVLGAGVEGLASHDQPGALGPVLEVDQVGELRDVGTWSRVAVLADGRHPASGVTDGFGDRCVDLGVGPRDDGEADVAGPAVPHEPGAAR